MKGIRLYILLLLMTELVIVSGCDTGRTRAITGDYYNRKAGELAQTVVKVDSLKSFPSDFNSMSSVMAGKYGDAQAFAVIKFTRPSSTVLAILNKARLKLTVAGIWTGGTREFGLYKAGVDWTDSTTLDSSVYLSSLGSPMAVNVDTTETITSMVFDLDSSGLEYIKSWGSTGAFLVKNTDQGNALMNVYSYYSSYQPVMELITETALGVVDTTTTNAIDSAYAYDTGLTVNGKNGIISDGAATGFVLYITIPDSLSRTCAFNNGKMTIPISRNLIPTDGSMNIGAYLLTSKFTALNAAQTSGSYYSEFDIDETSTQIELDITGMLGVWAADSTSNYGILFKPIVTNSTPAQVVLTLPDSVGIKYTTIPEVE